MSQAKIHAFTAWVNLRLRLDIQSRLNNILLELFQDFHWQHLIENLTGSPFDKIGTFTGISQVQKITRIEWIIKELITWKLLDENTKINPKLVAVRNLDETFTFLLKLVHLDLYFIWLRMAFLQLDDCKEICKYEFRIFPEKQPVEKSKKFKVKKNLFAGFGAASEIYTEIPDENPSSNIRQRIFAHDAEMVSYKKANVTNPPSIPKPTICLLSIIKNHLKMSKYGRNMKINKLTELCDVRFLCAFFNTLICDSFTADILPNDRWSINLIIRTLEKVLKIESDFEAADLNSNQDDAITTYFTTILLKIYQFRQCMKVLEYKDNLKYKIRLARFSEEMSSSENNPATSLQKEEYKSQIEEATTDLKELQERFDIKFCDSWKIHQKKVLREANEILRNKINYQFEVIRVPRTMSIGDLCNKCFLVTKSSSCSGFYQMKSSETISEDRKIILRDLNNNKIIFDTDGKSKSKVRVSLKVSQIGPVECDPEKISKYEIYLDSSSKNKFLSADDNFLYELFSTEKRYWKNLLLKFSSTNDAMATNILARLFSDDKTFVDWQEPSTGDSALHLATKNGYSETVFCLLENGAEVDIRNRFKQTPLFYAVDTDNEKICEILLEWGANIYLTNSQNFTVLDMCKTGRMKAFVENKFIFYSGLSNSVVNGNSDLLQQSIHDHRVKSKPLFFDLRSRCLQGTTLLHTATHFGNIVAIKELLMLRVDVDQQDYKGASSLHRAKNLEAINLLIEAGADVNMMDDEQNQPLHAACYGDENSGSQIEKIQILIKEGAELVSKNKQFLMPIHCAAMQGRCDVIELLLEADPPGQILQVLENEKLDLTIPSMNYLSVSGGFLTCAQWLLDRGFNFKENEVDQLLQNIITGKLVLHGNSLSQAINLLLCKSGLDINKRYPPSSQTALHLVAHLPDSTDLLTILIEAGADINATDNGSCTPLFISCKNNDMQSAKVLIDHHSNLNAKNDSGQTAFDYILDYVEWINSGLFDGETVARLKAYNLKSTRNTVRSIDKKIKSKLPHDNSCQLRQLGFRLDRNLLEDKIERSKSRYSLQPRSMVH